MQLLKNAQTLAIANCNARMHAGFHGHSNRQILFKITDYRHPERVYFSKILNFWAWADILG